MDGGTVRLPALIGLSRAMDMILTGRPVGAEEALLMGMVWEGAERCSVASQYTHIVHCGLNLHARCMHPHVYHSLTHSLTHTHTHTHTYNAHTHTHTGLANRVVPKGKSLEEALKLANQIAKFPQQCLRADRRSAYFAMYRSQGFLRSLGYEHRLGAQVFHEARAGARKFIEGMGRGGKFN